ncbi:MAG: methyltransferase family protein [Acidobacteriota bacterium]
MNVQRIRVPVGFLFTAVYLYFSRPTPVWFYPGVLLATLGLALRVWATGHLEKWKGLATDGPYRWTRNPLYLGSFVMGAGLMIASSRLLLLIVFLVLFVSIYDPVMRREEKEMRQGYGGEFEAYRRRVPRFFPLLVPTSRRAGEATGGVACNFLWSRVISNREYKAVVGFLLVTALVYLKMGWN